MPRINDITNPSKKFKKKQYRPWDMLDELISEKNNQLDTNKIPISNQLDTNKIPISNQLVTNKIPISNQLDTNKVSISNRIRYRNKISIRSQLDLIKPGLEEALNSIKRLYGLQKKILFYIVDHCCLRGQLSSGEITNESLRLLTKTDGNTIKTAINRLISKGLLEREPGKKGVGGFCSFLINESVRNAIIEEKKRLDSLDISNQLVTKLVTDISNQLDLNKVSNKVPITSSSSSDLIKTTTTSESNFEKNLDHFEDWKKVDLSPLTEIGLSQAHLFQIAKQNLIPSEVVQESIDAFAFDLTKNNKAKSLKKTPLDFFMGILRNGSAYAPPPNYKSPKEIALEAFIEKQNRIQELEEKAVKLSFQNWAVKLTTNEKNDMIPAETKKMGVSGLNNQALFTYFKENVWPSMREDILKKPINES